MDEDNVRFYVADGGIYFADGNNEVLFYCVSDENAAFSGITDEYYLGDQNADPTNKLFSAGDSFRVMSRVDMRKGHALSGNEPRIVTHQEIVSREVFNSLRSRYQSALDERVRTLDDINTEILRLEKEREGLSQINFIEMAKKEIGLE